MFFCDCTFYNYTNFAPIFNERKLLQEYRTAEVWKLTVNLADVNESEILLFVTNLKSQVQIVT